MVSSYFFRGMVKCGLKVGEFLVVGVMENPNPTVNPNPDANQLPEADSLPDGFVRSSSSTVDQLGPEMTNLEDPESVDYKEEKLVDPNLRPELVGDDLHLGKEKNQEAAAVVVVAGSSPGKEQLEEECQSSEKCNYLCPC